MNKPHTPLYSQIFEGKKAAIFDIDGTLVNSLSNWDKVVEIFAKKYKVNLTAKEFYASFGADTLLTVANATVKELNLNMTGEEMMEELGEIYFGQLFKEEDFFPFAKAFLSQLRRNNIKYAAATAGNMLNYKVFEEMYMPDYFISAETLQVTKPNPAVFFNAIESLGYEPKDCVIFEDSIAGLEAARSTGSTVVCYLSSAADFSKKSELSDFIIASWEEVIE